MPVPIARPQKISHHIFPTSVRHPRHCLIAGDTEADLDRECIRRGDLPAAFPLWSPARDRSRHRDRAGHGLVAGNMAGPGPAVGVAADAGMRAAPEAAMLMADGVSNVSANVTASAAGAAEPVVAAAPYIPPEPVVAAGQTAFGSPALWFLLGAILATLFILIFLFIKDRKSNA